MPTQADFFNSEIALGAIKAIILLILIFYAIFSLIIIRQVDLMSKTLISGISSILKLTTLINAIFAIGLIVFTLVIIK